MVSSALVDALVSPSQALNDLFAKAVADGTAANDLPSIVRDHFATLFSGDALDQVDALQSLCSALLCTYPSL